MSVSVLDPETDIMDQFLDPETDIMGEWTYIGGISVWFATSSKEQKEISVNLLLWAKFWFTNTTI